MGDANDLRQRLIAACKDYGEDGEEDVTAREEHITAIISLTDALLAEDDQIPQRKHDQQVAQRVTAEKAALARTHRVSFAAAGICVLAGLLVGCSVWWFSVPPVVLMGSMISVALGLAVLTTTIVDEHPESDGVSVPHPSMRWAASGAASSAAVAFVLSSWGITAGVLGWGLLMVPGIVAWLTVIAELLPHLPTGEAAR